MQASGAFGSLPGLPDPERDRQFYEGVPSRRLAAWVFDVVVILAIGVPLGLFFGLVTFGLGFAAFPFLIGCVSFAYRIATISSGSATWGMRLMGIELRKFDGSRFDLPTAVMHTAIYVVSFAFFLIQIISCAFMISTRYGQGLPDLVLRTTAINRPAD
jgi:uncharacterized RDD family membrane protein YckC